MFPGSGISCRIFGFYYFEFSTFWISFFKVKCFIQITWIIPHRFGIRYPLAALHLVNGEFCAFQSFSCCFICLFDNKVNIFGLMHNHFWCITKLRSIPYVPICCLGPAWSFPSIKYGIPTSKCKVFWIWLHCGKSLTWTVHILYGSSIIKDHSLRIAFICVSNPSFRVIRWSTIICIWTLFCWPDCIRSCIID